MKSRKSPPASFSLPPASHEQITARAHRLWIEAGRPDGMHREHWFEAERQLRDPTTFSRRKADDHGPADEPNETM
jgi:hypothetical protein